MRELLSVIHRIGKPWLCRMNSLRPAHVASSDAGPVLSTRRQAAHNGAPGRPHVSSRQSIGWWAFTRRAVAQSVPRAAGRHVQLVWCGKCSRPMRTSPFRRIPAAKRGRPARGTPEWGRRGGTVPGGTGPRAPHPPAQTPHGERRRVRRFAVTAILVGEITRSRAECIVSPRALYRNWMKRPNSSAGFIGMDRLARPPPLAPATGGRTRGMC